jgi:hypothetical protein
MGLKQGLIIARFLPVGQSNPLLDVSLQPVYLSLAARADYGNMVVTLK